MSIKDWARRQDILNKKEQFYNEAGLKEIVDGLTAEQKLKVDTMVVGLARHISEHDTPTKIFLLFHYVTKFYAFIVKEGYDDDEIDAM